MQFHVKFTYNSENRENLLRFLGAGGLDSESPLKVVGAWVAVESGSGYAIIQTKDALALHNLCSEWSEYGEVNIDPIVSVKEI